MPDTSGPENPPTPHTPTECIACRIAGQLAEHRDKYANDWTTRRATLNFAVIIARRECPAHQRAWEVGV